MIRHHFPNHVLPRLAVVFLHRLMRNIDRYQLVATGDVSLWGKKDTGLVTGLALSP